MGEDTEEEVGNRHLQQSFKKPGFWSLAQCTLNVSHNTTVDASVLYF